jgi:glutathione S-transferase
MKLFFFPVAPNPTRVRLYLAEKAAGGHPIELTQELVQLPRGEQRAPEHLARNPLGKLPVLELDDGSFLTESVAIVEYLEECHPEPPLFGRTAEARARTRELDRIAETAVLGPVARTIHATNSPLGLPPNPGVAEDARATLPAGLRVLEARLSDGRPWLAGDEVTFADCTLASAYQFARFGKVALPPDLPHLAAWDERFRERPAAREVLVT